MSRILVFRPGQLGDTLIAIPSLSVLRERFPTASITILHDQQVGKQYVLAREVLDGTSIVDGFLAYPSRKAALANFRQAAALLVLLIRIRRARFTTLVYLAPSRRTPKQVARDRLYFQLAGIREFYGMTGFLTSSAAKVEGPLPVGLSEADSLLARLNRSGLKTPPIGQGKMDFSLPPAVESMAQSWLRRVPKGHPVLAVGPGSKMPVKMWPEDRYRQVIQRLIHEFDMWPIVFRSARREADRGLG